MEDFTFPRFQYSIFDKNGADAQWVVRGNNKETFLQDVAEVKAIVQANLEKHNPIMAATKDVNSHPCKVCGGETEYRTGTKVKDNGEVKEWKAYFCKVNKSHAEWLR